VNHPFHLAHLFLDFQEFPLFLECHLFLVFLEVLEEGMQVDDPRIDTTGSV
jgi:hypothetical protein